MIKSFVLHSRDCNCVRSGTHRNIVKCQGGIIMERTARVAFFVVFLLAGSSLAQSIPTVDYTDHMHISSAYHLGEYSSYSRGVASSDRCVVGLDGDGMWVLAGQEDEISATPLFVTLGSFLWSVQMVGDLAFVAGGPSLTIVDLTEPTAPAVIGATSGLSAYKFGIEGDYVYMAGSQAMYVVDISDLHNPQNVATLPTAIDVHGIAVADGFVYLAEEEAGIRIIDVSDPTTPVALGIVPRTEYIDELQIHEGDLYVGGWGLFASYDIPTPGSLALRWSMPVDANIQGMDFVDDMAYLAGGPVMLAMRISGPGSPVIEGEYPFDNINIMSIATRNDHTYLATYSDEFLALDIGSLSTVPPLDTAVTSLSNLATVDGLVFGRTPDGLECYEVDTAGQLSLAGTSDFPSYYTNLALDIQTTSTNRYLWSADNHSVLLFDISAPTAMSYELALSQSNTPGEVCEFESYLAVLDGPELVRLYWVGNPLTPSHLSNHPLNFAASYMEMTPFTIHLAGGTTYQINWDEGSGPIESSLTLPGNAEGLWVRESSAIVALSYSLVLIDVSDYAAPVIVDELVLPGAVRDLDALEGWGYVAFAGGNTVFSYDNQAGLMLVGACASAGFMENIALGDDCAFLLANGGDLLTLPLQTPTPVNCNSNDTFDLLEIAAHPSLDWNDDGTIDNCQQGQGISAVPTTARAALHDASPNPFNPRTVLSFELPQASIASLRVYDVAGRLVRTLLDDEMAQAGLNEVTWGGSDDTGRRVPSGVYFYRLDAGPSSATKRMALIK